MKPKFSHIDASGKAKMVDVSKKTTQIRTAKAIGHITLSPETIILIRKDQLKKGDVLTIAEVAGIQGGKKSSELIPLCHPLQITKLDVKAILDDSGIEVTSLARCIGQTGIEMEALTAVSIALLTIYDMCKAADKSMVIDEIKLIEKTKENMERR
ncbi:MAG: cyclic pyranopterin monophosphate synthase MoaC [Bacteroidetes bacterium]|nr:cyclic pyranopterin monophosphate synthase MoaC [Bacteroidota bacterium]